MASPTSIRVRVKPRKTRCVPAFRNNTDAQLNDVVDAGALAGDSRFPRSGVHSPQSPAPLADHRRSDRFGTGARALERRELRVAPLGSYIVPSDVAVGGAAAEGLLLYGTERQDE